jgi:hypothetical protein
MCGFYATINAFQLLFPGTFSDEDAWELMAVLCRSIAHKFPAVIWKGAGVEDTARMLEAASAFSCSKKHLGGAIAVTRPFARRKMARMQDFWTEIGAWLAGEAGAEGRRVAFIGIGHPDHHWTIVSRKSERSVTFFDSWELKRLPLRQFTISDDVARTKSGMHKLDTRQTFLIERVSKP